MKPNRKLFFISVMIWFALGCNIVIDNFSSNDLTFGIGVIASSFVYFIIGVFIIYGENARDKVFYIEPCPSCKSLTISIKDKLKSAPDETRSNCYCSSCKSKLKLHYSFYFFSLVIIFLPAAVLIILDSVLLMFIVFCISMPLGIWFYSKYIRLIEVND